MALVNLVGTGIWMPTWPGILTSTPVYSTATGAVLDANTEEVQFIGRVTIDGGGSKTFGTSSKIGWPVGPTVTFATGSTLRVGVKQASKIDMATGPPARATTGTAAFDVYDDLVGGTDTLTQLSYREDTMTAGTPLTVADQDWLAVCFYLTLTSGTPSIKVAGTSVAGVGMTNSTSVTLVTSGSVYTAQGPMLSGVAILFNDGSLGWLEPSRIFTGASDVTTGGIGNGNSFANIIRVPFPCKIDALGAMVTTSTGIGDCALELVETPLGTPVTLASIALDANVMNVSTGRAVVARFATPQTLAANTDYAISLKQTTANTVLSNYWDVPISANYFKPMGMGAECYAVNSTAGATFVSQNSGRRRYLIWMRVSAVDDGASGALRTSRVPKREALRFARR
jgi:hypothetical protein